MSSFFTKFTATQQKDRCGLQLKGKEFNVDTARVRSLVGSRCIAQTSLAYKEVSDNDRFVSHLCHLMATFEIPVNLFDFTKPQLPHQ